ncbi:MAG: ABC transporter ATP-binding protein [Candidatus Gracilibacteria bacterium]|nr:ABC transporter ATP-binding protein [Candidatus Gracilibacteria bacterium]
MKKYSFWELTKIYLAPLGENKKRSYFEMFRKILIVSQLVLCTEFFRRFILQIENYRDFDGSLKYIIAISILTVAIFILELVSYANFTIVWINAYRYLYRKYLKSYIMLDNEEIMKYGTGKFISIIKTGIDEWADSLVDFYDQLLISIFGFSINLILICFIDVRLIAPVIIFSGILVLLIYLVNKKTLYYRNFRRESQDDVVRQVVKIIMEKFTILKNDKIGQEMKVVEKLLNDFEFSSIKTAFYINLMKVGSNNLLILGRIMLVTICGYLGVKNGYSISNIAVIIIVSNFLSDYTIKFADAYRRFSKNFPRITKLIEIFDEIPTIEGYENGNKFEYKSGEIKIENISFAYKSGDYVFKNFSLNITGGTKLALIGKSGVGKTTLIKLLLGFVRPESGNIFIDEQNMKDFSLKSYYEYLGYLSQEPAVFDGTIKENLIYGLRKGINTTKEKLNEVIELAQCDFIEKLPKGLETEIGEKGVRLSGGERQRLAIARLFLENPKIIILDEPTAALDSFSEVKISQALENLFKNKTVIIIAHRLQTVKGADEIIVLGKNKILESGKHKDLIKNNGTYSKMVDLQSGIVRE